MVGVCIALDLGWGGRVLAAGLLDNLHILHLVDGKVVQMHRLPERGDVHLAQQIIQLEGDIAQSEQLEDGRVQTREESVVDVQRLEARQGLDQLGVVLLVQHGEHVSEAVLHRLQRSIVDKGTGATKLARLAWIAMTREEQCLHPVARTLRRIV